MIRPYPSMRRYLLLFILLILTACAHGGLDSRGSYTGLASWYGPNFNGKLTASGEVYDMHALTAAHKTLPLGTIVEVENLENNKTVRLTINDRGPFVRGRIIDLSYQGAVELGVVKKGTARVRVTPVGRDRRYIKYIRVLDSGSGEYTVQLGAFTSRDKAERLLKALGVEGRAKAYISEARISGRLFYRVRAGDFATRAEAKRVAESLAYEGYETVLRRK